MPTPLKSQGQNRNLIDEIKQSVSILQYAEAAGYTPEKVGRYYTLKEHDSVRIDPEKNYFWRNSTGAKGDIIDFVKEMEQVDTSAALRQLSRYTGNRHGRPARTAAYRELEKEKKMFTLPEKGSHHRNVFAYLSQTRGISPALIQKFMHEKRLYQDTRGNCVFVSYDNDGNPNFGCIRGTNTEKKFRGDIAGSDYDKGFFIDNGSDTLIVTESVIDSMSIMTLDRQKGLDPSRLNYLATSGTSKIGCVTKQLQARPDIGSVILALDNDEAGKLEAVRIRAELTAAGWQGDIRQIIPVGKDWNEDLTKGIEQHAHSPKIGTESPKRLFVDMDGTLAEFQPVDHLETLYEKGYFENLKPHKNVVEAVKELIKNHPEIEIHILSAHLPDSPYALAEKNAWLDRHLPEIDASRRIFPPCGIDKAQAIPGGIRETDFLLDDYTRNLMLWQSPARGIKLLNGINHRGGTWQHDRLRYDKPPEELARNLSHIMQGELQVHDLTPPRRNEIKQEQESMMQEPGPAPANPIQAYCQKHAQSNKLAPRPPDKGFER